MGLLSLALLGKPKVRHGGAELAFPTRKTLALLIYLALEDGRHAREKLAALFWPESGPEPSRAMLRYTLSQLRGMLDHAGEPPHLIVERDALGLDPRSAFELDLHALRAAHDHVRAST